MCEVPRVLVLGQPFNELSGGGITITNLFKGWPKDRLASTFVAWNDSIVSMNVCTNYYVIGSTEHSWRFPVNFFKKPFPGSGINLDRQRHITVNKIRKATLHNVLSDSINPILQWLGFYHVASRIALSETLKTWIRDFNPDILYIQVSTLEGIDFANQLIDFCSIPTVIHMMDDWPSTLGRNGLFPKYWNGKINREYIKLLDKIDTCLAISDAMGMEYKTRYGRQFDTFHNPVEFNHNNLKEVVNYEPHHSFFRVLYVGRIGTANRQTIISFAHTISTRISNSKKIQFDIFSKDCSDKLLDPIRSYDTVSLKEAIQHTQIINLLAEYDLLLLPLDFTEDGIRFAKFSIPTKATEYMVSGVPILVFAPEETAVSRFFRDHDCGFCLTNNSSDDIINAINYLISNTDYRMKISQNAVKVAVDNFDAEKVRSRFRETLIKTVQQKK